MHISAPVQNEYTKVFLIAGAFNDRHVTSIAETWNRCPSNITDLLRRRSGMMMIPSVSADDIVHK